MNHPSDDPMTCCPTCGGDGTIDPFDDLQIGSAQADSLELLAKVKADARALWADAALDAWRTANTRRQHVERSKDEAGSVCEVELYFERIDSKEYHYGPTPRAARLAAARAVWPDLPEPVRRKLGECP
jgi:hypothetical protein